ncbi:hypothetical protein SVAN01_02024 [Stagonosporopsis vannaccii]|nr:hypothetical protein SVAN01_02024 [Stagonosporopsis vannaccii]
MQPHVQLRAPNPPSGRKREWLIRLGASGRRLGGSVLTDAGYQMALRRSWAALAVAREGAAAAAASKNGGARLRRRVVAASGRGQVPAQGGSQITLPSQ